MSEQFAHEGAPNGESTESDVVDPAVETDEPHGLRRRVGC